MDIFAPFTKIRPSEKKLIRFGRISGILALLIGAVMAPLLGNIEQAFQFIQEYTGLVSPGILAIFILGLFTRLASNKGAIIGVLVSIVFALYFKVGANGWVDSVFFPALPFMHQMGITFLLTCGVVLGVSAVQHKGQFDSKGFKLYFSDFKTGWFFNAISVLLIGIVGLLYWFLKD